MSDFHSTIPAETPREGMTNNDTVLIEREARVLGFELISLTVSPYKREYHGRKLPAGMGGDFERVTLRRDGSPVPEVVTVRSLAEWRAYQAGVFAEMCAACGAGWCAETCPAVLA